MPYFRFFPSDWLAGTGTLRAMEKGVYITLIAAMYDSSKPLPEDHTRLARMSGCTRRAFAGILEVLIGDGKVLRTDDGLWNKRVEREVFSRRKVVTTAQENANVRWQKRQQKQLTADADAFENRCETDANQSPYIEKKEVKANGQAVRPPPVSEKFPVQKAFDNYNLVAHDLGLPIANKLTTERKRKLRLRLQDGSLEEWNRALVALGEQPFLTGENNRGWRASLDFLLQPSSYMKILEGQYAQEGGRDGGL